MGASAGGGNRRGVRVALAFGVLSGIVYLAAVPLLRPDQIGVATDVYSKATTAALAGQDPYAVHPPGRPGYTFVYPPAVLLAFVPHVFTGSELGAFALQTVTNLLAAGAIAWLLVRSIERADVALSRLDRALIVAFVMGSAHTVSVLVMGQINLQLALVIALGAILLESTLVPEDDAHDGIPSLAARLPGDRGVSAPATAGALVALAASVKLFPAVVGAWFLRLRSIRAVAAATATGVGVFVLGIGAFGIETTRTYLTTVIPAERHAGEFAGGLGPNEMYVTVRRPLGAAFPSTDPGVLAGVALVFLAVPVLASYRDVSTRTGRQVALLATVLAALLLLPLEPFYYSLLYYPLVPLLYTLEPGRGRQLLVWGTILLSTIVTYNAVTGLLAIAPLSGSTAASVDAAARSVFSVAQPPLFGAMLILAGCVVVQRELASRRGAAAPPEGPP